MALHVCRDFLSWGNPLNMFGPYYANYLLIIFLRGVAGFVTVGQTNCNIDGPTYTLGTGIAGSLNQGGGDVYAFLPNGYTPTSADIGRILALRSPGNPMVNSGLFRITGINTSNGWVYINYRSGDIPPPETGMTWTIYENETVFYNNVQVGGNGVAGTYQTQGAGAASTRIALQSPSSLNWQVRICWESNYDQINNGGGCTPNANGGTVTCVPGYGASVTGDYAPGGQHLHGVAFFNTHDTQHVGTTPGFWPNSPGSSAQGRLYMWADDVTGAVFAAFRSVVNGGCDSFIHFGMCVNEEQPLPPHNAQRLFVIGANGYFNGGQNGIYWATNGNAARNGMSFGLSNQPVTAIYSLYNPLFGGTYGGSSGNNPIRASNNAGDNQYIASSELIPVDIVAGTQDYAFSYSDTYEHLILEGRRLGQAPFVQMGRSNYGYFQISTDPQHAWLHLNDGIYLPWQGSILP